MALNDSTFELSTFAELSPADLYRILQLRSAVFVLEQSCAYQDLDGLDQQSLHLYKKSTGDIVAYARILTPDQCNQAHTSIGRVVVSKTARKEHLGRALMQAAIHQCHQQFPKLPIKISAQTYLTDFYHRLGFINTGHYYLEDDIPHQEMLYQPN